MQEALVSGISVFLNQGVAVSGFSVNKNAENPRTSDGKFRKQEDGETENTNKVRELRESKESKKESNAPASGTILPPFKKVDEIYPETFSVEAEKNSQSTSPGGGGAIRVTLYDNETPGVEIHDAVPEQPAPQTKPTKTGRTPQPCEEIPESLNTPKFLAAWQTLCSMPKWKNKPQAAREMSLKKLSAFNVDFATEQVESAISGNWQGVVFPDTAAKYSSWMRGASRNNHSGMTNRSGINGYGGNPDKYKEKQIF